MRTPLAILPMLLLLVASCTHRYYYSAAEVQPQQAEVIYTHGLPSLRIYHDSVDVIVHLTNQNSNMHDLSIYVRNDRTAALDVRTEGIKVSGFYNAKPPHPFRVYSAEEYINKKNTEAIIVGVATIATITAIAIAADGSAPDDSEYYNTVDYGAELFWWLSVAATTTIAAEAAAGSPPPNEIYSSEDALLRRHTLFPGEALQGVVKVKGQNSNYSNVLVEIPIEGDYLKFNFGPAQAWK